MTDIWDETTSIGTLRSDDMQKDGLVFRYNHYLYPATHYASAATNTSVNLPAMGQRVRLKSGFVIPANWTKQRKRCCWR